jgi:hypothetical protein
MARKHYDILQIKPDASADEIQHAYRKLAMRYHPDRNPAPDAAAKMADINEAYEVLQNPIQRGNAEAPISKANQTDDLIHSILSAARAVILRNGWTVTHEENSLVLFETGNPRVRIALTDRLRKDSLLRISRQFREIVAVLAVQIEDPIASGMKITVIDLMHAQWHGAPVPDGPCKSLLSGFL